MRGIVVLFLLGVFHLLNAQNPIIPNKGVNDPHIRIFSGKAWLSATHDKSMENKRFIMEDWWLWSSDDLVDWKLETVLKPEDTYIGKPFSSCWATDIIERNGKYYWYFSEANRQAGVVVADKLTGPWKDPLGKPLLSSDLTPTHEYDMGIIKDTDGEYYIVFGVWDFYIARLNEDMISLAEEPRLIQINNPRGPYNQDGNNPEKATDDKPYLHYYNGKYYLSWGCFYAMSDNVYGPYQYKGSVMEKESFAEGYDAPTWPNGFKQGRHGSFFQWHNQWYFTYCDISQTGNRFFRDSFISYLHYKDNGEMALVRVDGVGVGQYNAAKGKIEAEDYFKAYGTGKYEIPGGFAVGDISNNDYLVYPNIKGLQGKSEMHISASVLEKVVLEIRYDSPEGPVVSTFKMKDNKGSDGFSNFSFDLPLKGEEAGLCFVFKGKNDRNLIEFDSFEIK